MFGGARGYENGRNRGRDCGHSLREGFRRSGRAADARDGAGYAGAVFAAARGILSAERQKSLRCSEGIGTVLARAPTSEVKPDRRKQMATDVVMPQMGESIFEGTITKWLKKPGDKVERDEPLFEISTDKVDAEIPSPSAGVLKEIKIAEGQTVPIQTIVAVIDGAGGASASVPSPAQAATPAKSAVLPQASQAQAPAAARPASPPSAPAQAAPAAGTSSSERIHSSPLVRKLAKEHGVDLSTIPGTGAAGRITKEDIEAV